jgi:hypothetical protein
MSDELPTQDRQIIIGLITVLAERALALLELMEQHQGRTMESGEDMVRALKVAVLSDLEPTPHSLYHLFVRFLQDEVDSDNPIWQRAMGHVGLHPVSVIVDRAVDAHPHMVVPHTTPCDLCQTWQDADQQYMDAWEHPWIQLTAPSVQKASIR